jgi:tRNA pseudouridine55 synthase
VKDPQHTGFVLVDKPGGWTSHDVVAKTRRLAGQRKIGHAGTLDPMATGLLVLGLGRATRLLRFVQHGVKEYVATVRLGVATDSLDADGAVLSREPMPVGLADVESVLPRFLGSIHQVPPMVSARKVEGRRLYELAREGTEVEREARPVEIQEIAILDFAPSDYPELSFRVRCSTGTYVRSLADDIARALGGRGHLVALRRTKNGRLGVEQATALEDLAALADEGRFADAVMGAAQGLADMEAIHVDRARSAAVRNGVPFAATSLGAAPGSSGPFRMLDDAGVLLAVYRIDGGKAKPEVVVA